MGEFFRFTIAFFSDWRRIVGFWALLIACGAVTEWIEDLYVRHQLRSVDHFIMGSGAVILSACSAILLVIKPQVSKKPPSSRPTD